MDISKVNIEICDTLNQEYNEVIYKAWLSFIETAVLENDHIIISVPNQYIRETFEERYAFDVEELYRKSVGFNKLIVKTPDIEALEGNNIFPLTINNTIADISEMVNSYMKNSYGFVSW